MSRSRGPARPARRLHATGLAWMLMAACLLALPAAVQAGTPDFTFNLYVGGGCVSGVGPVSASIDLTLRNSNDVIKAKETTSSNATGHFSDCFSGDTIESGDKVRAVSGPAARTFTVPPLSATTNRVTDVVTGIGPPNSMVTLYLYSCPGFGNCAFETSRVRPTNGNGKYTTDFTSAHDIRGHDFVTVSWLDSQGDIVYRSGYVSWVIVEPDQRRFYGYGNLGELVTVKLWTGGGALRGSGQAVTHPSYANYSGEFRKSDLSPVQVRVGNKVTSSFGSNFTIPTTSLTGKASTDIVSGNCSANRAFQIYAYDPLYARPTPSSYAYGTTNAGGAFSADMSNPDYPGFNLMHDDLIQVRCMTAGGDEIALDGTVP